MNNWFKKAVIETTETRALFLLLFVLCLRAWRAIPNIRPIQLLFPATISQITVFIIAAFNTDKFLYIVAIGNLLILSIVLFPATLQRNPKFHWVKA